MVRMIPLTDVCNPKQWKTLSLSELQPQGYPVYGANGVIGYYSQYNHLEPTLMIGCRGSCGTITMSVEKAWINGNAMCLDNLSPTIDSKYLRHYLTNFNFTKIISGTSQPQITRQSLKNVFVPVRELFEQKRIAAVLDKICELKKNAVVQIENLDLLVKSRFVEMFGDPTINGKGWSVSRLSELGELNRGVSKARPRNSPDLLGGPYPLVQTGEVANSRLYIRHYNATYSEKGLAQSRLWKRGTLCITIAANIAQTAILDFDACFPDSVVGFVPNERTNAIFIHYWFSFFQQILETQAPQVAQKNINLQILSGLKVVEPPLALQREFAAFVEKVEKLKDVAKKSVEEMDTLYRAKLQEYFG